MARERMITRTIKTDIYNVLGMDTEKAEIKEILCLVSCPYEEKHLEKLLQRNAALTEGENFKPCKWEKVNTIEQVYGIPESLFLELATPIER